MSGERSLNKAVYGRSTDSLDHSHFQAMVLAEKHASIPSGSRSSPFDDLSTEIIEIIFNCACFDPAKNHEIDIYLPKTQPAHGSRPFDVDEDTTDPWILSLVCTRWRDIVLAQARLWSNIYIMFSQDRGQLEWKTWGFSQLHDTLINSGTHPLQITLRSDDHHDTHIIPKILDILMYHRERWQRITIQLPWLKYCAIDSLKGRLPLLKQLRIEVTQDINFTKALERLICPSLEWLEIEGGYGPAIAKFLDISSCSLMHLHLCGTREYNHRAYDITPILRHPCLANLNSLSLNDDTDLESPIFHSRGTLPLLDTFTYNINDYCFEGLVTCEEMLSQLVESMQNFVRSRTEDIHYRDSALSNATWNGSDTFLKKCFFNFHFDCDEALYRVWLEGMVGPLRDVCLERDVDVQLTLKFNPLSEECTADNGVYLGSWLI